MQYMDPLSTQCEFCQAKSDYSVEDLMAYKAKCNQCGKTLEHAANTMHEAEKAHKTDTWCMFFIFEGFDSFDVDIDALNDEEIDTIETVQDFALLVNDQQKTDIAKDIPSMKILQPIISKIELDNILEYKLSELALLANNG